MTHVPYKLHIETALARTAGLTGWLKGASRKRFNLVFGNPAKKRLGSALDKLSLYCQAPDPKAENATELHGAMKQWTWWPQEGLLEQIRDSALTLVKTERKYPERLRPWEVFERVDKRNLKLRLVKRINDLVLRAKDRFLEANFSDLEALSWDENARSLLRDIDRIREDTSAAKTINWAKYKETLSSISDNGRFPCASANDAALACYARVLEMIIDHRKWGKLRKNSEPLVYWLLEIGYPGVSGPNGLEQFNGAASLRWLWEKARRIQQKREARLEKLRQSGFQKEWDEESKEDARLMRLIAKGDLKALESLRHRYGGMVRGIVYRVMHNNQDVDEITLKVFDKVGAAEYIPTPGFKTWLSTIAKRRAIDELRRRGKSNLVELWGFDPDDEPGLRNIETDSSGDWSWQPPEQ